jgi:predicted lysophospholipase L1 biosynthesis ABC-type transport system permease subunit
MEAVAATIYEGAVAFIRRQYVTIGVLAILGAVAGFMGGALATAFSRLLLTRFLDAGFRLELLPNLATILLTTGLAIAAGWLASLRILRQRPLEVLRDE